MKFVLFYHSLISDWNHGNAHFLRGVASELLESGHQVTICEPKNGWSLSNLKSDEGIHAIRAFSSAYPHLKTNFYDESTQIERILDDADVVMVHEWNDTELVARIGRHKTGHGGYHLLFHDTHHRSVTDPETIEKYDLSHFDGVLAFGDIIRQIYLERSWIDRAWTWHEAADTSIFRPLKEELVDSIKGWQTDLVWVGNWGDNERSEEIRNYLIAPVQRLKLQAIVHGVRYPQDAIQSLKNAGIQYRGWLPNYQVPQAFNSSSFTIHIPRRPYREILHGVPTIRIFEALSCGIPLICLRWNDSERLFQDGRDYLVVDNPKQMIEAMRLVLADHELRRKLTTNGLQSIQERHTCVHRVKELLDIVAELNGERSSGNNLRCSREGITPS